MRWIRQSSELVTASPFDKRFLFHKHERDLGLITVPSNFVFFEVIYQEGLRAYTGPIAVFCFCQESINSCNGFLFHLAHFCGQGVTS